MSQAHLDELSKALTQRGWSVGALPNVGEEVCGSWVVRRGLEGVAIHIDFDRLDGDGKVVPIEKSYGCSIRERPSSGLHFSAINRSRKRWKRDLSEFVRSLDRIDSLEASGV
jgi:hypothetical protein